MSLPLRTLALVLPLLVFLVAPLAPASAVVASSNTVFYFTGTCTDCSGTVTGELTLSNYAYGDAIGSGNFVSFHYDGSNLLPAFTIAAPSTFESGTINNNLPGPEDVHASSGFFTTGYYFNAYTNGTWNVGTANPILLDIPILSMTDYDQGTAGTFSLTPGATAVPEPASLALLSAGLLGLRLVRRRPTA